MNYILKHRRGTTAEWLESSVIPEEGELIIEELEKGSRKCKIGDGVSKFIDLPYIEDDTKELILKSLTILESNFNKNLASLNNNQQKKLVELKSELTNRLATYVNLLETSIIEGDNEILKKSQQEITHKISELELILSDTNKNTLNTLDKKVNDLATQLEADLQSNVELLEEKLEVLDQKVESSFSETNNNCESQVNTLTNLIESNVTNLEKDFNTKITDTQESLRELLQNSYTQHSLNLLNIRDTLDNKIASTDERQAILADKLNKAIKLTDETLNTKIEELKQQGNLKLVDILEQLRDLQSKASQLDANDINLLNKFYSLNNTLHSVINSVAADIETLTHTHESDQENLYKNLDSVETTFCEVTANLLDLIHTYVTKIYIELGQLEANDLASLRKIFTIENSLFNNIENLKSSTNIRLSESQKALDDLSSTVQKNNLETQKSFGQFEADLQETENKIADDLDKVNNKLTQVNNQINRANTELRIQSNRISNIVSLTPGSTTGDAELIDIRSGYDGITHESAGDAVRAIGNSLEELKTSLPDYIPANAIDGLLYEDNLLYLTSDGVPVSDPVEITGGSGGGGGSTSTVKLKNNLSSTAFTIAKGNDAWIDFTYTSFENEVPTGDGTYSVSINNKKIEALSGSIQHNIAKRLKVTDYLKNGTNNIKVTCIDQYGTSRSLVYSISLIELRIESSFNSARVFDNTITFRYKIFGQIEKIVHIFIDGTEILNKKLNASVNGSESTLTIVRQPHGCHKIIAYLTAMIEDSEILSNILEYEIICKEDDNNTAMLTSVYNITEVTQGDLISIPFMLYDPTVSEASIHLNIYSKSAGELNKLDEYSTVRTVDREQQFWNTRKYPAGNLVFELSYTYNLYGITTTLTKAHEIVVKALDINISAEDDELQLYLSAEGRANNEADPAIWTFTQQPTADQIFTPITTTFENFNWKSNGWIKDDNEDTCLRLNGDARAIINFEPFITDFKAKGKTLEFEFLVRDVNSRDTAVINCYDGSKGFQATPDTAFLQSSGTKVSCRYKDNERVRVAVTVEYKDSISCFVSIYLDGILSGVQRYNPETDSFAQNNPLKIVLGSNLCGLDIYSIRIYDKALSTPQVLANYIADKAEPSVKKQLVTDNDILDDKGKISYERVKALGQVPIITFTGPMPAYKGDKKKNTTRMKFEDPSHPEMNFDVLLDQIDVQGTSSQFYARKNWKVKLPEARSHIPGAIPAKVFCIKVDYAEATGTHNTGSANYVETLYDRNEVTLPPQKDDTRVRTTIQGFPCILFEKATEDSEPVFSSKGNFNYDKDAEDTFGFTEAYKDFGVECWEFCNNTSDSVNFAGPIADNWLEDFTPRYVPKSANFERIEELQELSDLAASGKANMTEAQQQEFSMLLNNCIANFKEMHDWVLSTATYNLVEGKQVPIPATPLAEPVTYGETTYTEDNREYRLAKFKYEFENYFNIHYSSIYYVFTLFALMTDQRAKNMFLTRWKDEDGYFRWYPYFYDNDTIFGINNEGALVFDYYHEDIDQLGSSNVFNGQNSVLWHNFRLCFSQEIKDTYATLRSDKKLTYDAIINQYVTLGSDKWSAAIYNEDAEYKYIIMARPSGSDNKVDASNLYQVRGPGEHHLRYFVSNRLNYCDSKWYAGDYPSDFYFLRLYTPTTQIPLDRDLTEEELANYDETQVRIYKSLKAVPANPNITVTPFSNMYAGVKYKANGTLQQERLIAGQVHTFEPTSLNETFNDTETAIYGASELSSLGDLSSLYCGVVNLVGKNTDNTEATQGNIKENKLVELIIGNEHPDYYNDNFREIAVGTCRLLRKIDLRNCSGLGIAGNNPQKTLDLTGCPNIEHIYTEGTNLNSVSLPESGYVKTLHLPASINSLVIKNQKYISDFSIPNYSNIRTLQIEGCPTLNTNEILEACRKPDGDGSIYTVELVTLSGIDWHLEDATFVKSLFAKYDEQNPTQFISGIRSINADGRYIEAILKGKCYIENLSGEEYSEIRKRYPELALSYGEMKSNVIFKAADGITELHRELIEGKNSSTPDCPDPAGVKIDIPTKESTAEFDYEWIGWTRKLDGDLQADALLAIAGDRILYPAFKAIRKNYEVKFVNKTKTGETLLQTVITPYGSDAIYTEQIPSKQDSNTPNMYTFTGWYPSPEKITGPLTCYAQFTFLDSKWYTIGIPDITDCPENDKLVNGYELDHSNNTMSITICKNKNNAAIKIPKEFDFTEGKFTVVNVGGFKNHSQLELLNLPDSTKEISSQAFRYCMNLVDLNLPSSLHTIGREAFFGCSKLTEFKLSELITSIGIGAFANCTGLASILVDEANSRYYMSHNCLIDKDNKLLLQSLPNGSIPQDGSVTQLGSYCFSKTLIDEIIIPEGITLIPNNAFNYCSNLVNIKFPSTLKILDATCFSWCPKLTKIDLPEGLTEIRTFVFNECALNKVVIPSTVEQIKERAFAAMPTLTEVFFSKRTDNDGNIILPTIHFAAFKESGTLSEPIKFYLPWSETQHNAVYGKDGNDITFGATACEFIFNYIEEDI